MYEYSAIVVKVYDGDTITVDIDLGFGIVLTGQVVRLYGINTPEVRGESKDEGIAVRDFVRDLILDQTITLRTYKGRKGKYGRWLGLVTTAEGIDLNELLIKTGRAERYG